MTWRIWIPAALLGILLVGLLNCDFERRRALKEVVVGVEKGSDVLILTGLGKRLDRKEAVWGTGGYRENNLKVGYFSPTVHPDHERFVAVRCYEMPEGRSWSSSGPAEGCELAEWRIGGELVRVLFETPAGLAIDSPTWDPAGSRLAVWVGREVVLLDGRSGEELLRTEVPDLHAARPWDSRDDYLRWSADGSALYIAGATRDPRLRRTVSVIDPENGTFERFPAQPPDFLWGQHRDHRPMENDPALVALYGSPDHPVETPIYSSDRRFYFSSKKREGLFARGWIEGYDTWTGETFDLVTLWRHLHAV